MARLSRPRPEVQSAAIRVAHWSRTSTLFAQLSFGAADVNTNVTRISRIPTKR